MLDLRPYAELYSSLDILDRFDVNSPQSAFLLVSEDADGLSVLARLLAGRLCGISASRALDGHADIMLYPREDDKPAKKGKKPDTARAATVNVEDVRDIIDSLYLTPFELPRRVYIIHNAESMSEICQNKLLKSLEEPPPRVCFILCASGGLLPTVESRCTQIELPPFDVDTVYGQLRYRHPKTPDAEVRLAARAGRGNIGMSERMLSGTEHMSAYSDALKVLSLATGSRNFAHAAAAYDKFTRERAGAVLGYMEYLLGDIARALSGAETVFDAADIRGISAGFTPYSAAACAGHVRDAQARVLANCMPQAVMDGLILKIMEEKSLCLR